MVANIRIKFLCKLNSRYDCILLWSVSRCEKYEFLKIFQVFHAGDFDNVDDVDLVGFVNFADEPPILIRYIQDSFLLCDLRCWKSLVESFFSKIYLISK